MRKLVAIALSAFLLSTGWVKAQNVGEAAPDFDVTLLGGGMFSLSQHAGQVVVVFLFGNTCPYCLASGPTIEADLYQQFREDPNFVMIGVDTWNSSSTESSVTGFANSTGITFPLAVKAGEVATLYSTTYDRFLIIDADGILVHKGSSPTSSDLSSAIGVVQNSLADIGMNEECQGVEISLSGTITPPTCHGGADGVIDLTVSGDQPGFTFEWSNGSDMEDPEGLEAGDYVVKVTDSGGCSVTTGYQVQDPDPVTIGSISGETMVSGPGIHMYSLSGAGDLDIQWSVTGGTIVSGQGTSMIDVEWNEPVEGSVRAVGTGEGGCMSGEEVLNVSVTEAPTGISDRESTRGLVYPNPVGNVLFIDMEGPVTVQVTDLGGRRILSSEGKELDVSSLPAGLYHVQITSDKAIYSEKILIK